MKQHILKWCPVCDELIELKGSEETVTCDECRTVFRVDFDADFEDGEWRDCTRLLRQLPD